MAKATQHIHAPRRRTAKPTATRAKDLAMSSASGKPTQVPEWTTEPWKHRVEAEARNRLKREVRDVGAAR